ncbi:Aminopeptidase M1-A, partial [Durusdinium trenchii]
DFENFFTHNLRKPGSTLLQFCTEFDEKLRRLQAHGVKLPTTVQGKGHKAFVAEEGWDDLDEAFYQEDHGWEDDYEALAIESWQDDDFGFDQEAGYYQYDNEHEDEEEGFVATSDDSALHEDVEPFTVDFKTYKSQEGVSQDAGQTPVAEGSRKIVLKDWKRIDHALNHTERQLQAMVTSELHAPPRPRLIWEVYAALEKETDTLINGIQEAKKAMSELKSRGVTRLLDLNVANRRRIEDLESEEEEMEQEMEEEEEDLQPPVQRRRLEAPIGSPQAVAPALNDATQPAPDDEPIQSEPDLEYVGWEKKASDGHLDGFLRDDPEAMAEAKRRFDAFMAGEPGLPGLPGGDASLLPDDIKELFGQTMKTKIGSSKEYQALRNLQAKATTNIERKHVYVTIGHTADIALKKDVLDWVSSKNWTNGEIFVEAKMSLSVSCKMLRDCKYLVVSGDIKIQDRWGTEASVRLGSAWECGEKRMNEVDTWGLR